MSYLEQAIELKAQLDALRPLDSEQEKRIWQKFRFDWNYHSNNIEGNSLTFGETKSLLLHNITAQGKPLKDHIEITGHNEAINALLDLTRGETPLTESFFRGLHTMILRERYQVEAQTSDGMPTKKWVEVGQYKVLPNHVLTVTGETFRFADPLDVPEKMRVLIQDINELHGCSDAEALIAATRIHYDFVLIHPFDDGNGRMARLLTNLVLIKFGFPPAIVRTEDKENYFSALRQADGGQLDMFVEYIASCVSASLKTMLAGARGESMEEPDEQDRQIKMLAKLLEAKKGLLEVTRTLDTLRAVFANSLSPLASKLDEKSRSLRSLYRSYELTISVNGIYGPKDQVLEYELATAKSHLRPESTNMAIHADFSNLSYQGLETISHSWVVGFTTDLASYTVDYQGRYAAHVLSGRITKRYDQMLTSEEISTIAEAFVTEQIRSIQNVAGINLSNP